MASPVTGLDFVAVPSTDWPRSRAFYVDTLGLRPDGTGKAEFWVGQTCFGIYEPTTFGMEFAPQTTAHLALHVADLKQQPDSVGRRPAGGSRDLEQAGANEEHNAAVRSAAPLAKDGQAERLAVEAHRALLVRDGDGDEVRALDRDHASLLSRGAYR